jgi:phospholipid/cholesterol/gamma-HCH transport system substrate-binding protein
MPADSKTSWAKLRVGVMSVVAMVILAMVIVLITGSTNIFTAHAKIYTYLSDAATLTQGAPVNLNGIPIGKVKEINLSGLPDPQKIVRITMQVEKDKLAAIPVDSLTSVSSANVLGTKFINIKKGKVANTIRDEGTLPSLNTAEFEDVVQQGYAILTALKGTVDRINDVVVKVSDMVGNIEDGKGSIGKLLVDSTLYDNLLKIVGTFQELANSLNSNTGTIGKLIHDPALYDQIHGELARFDDILKGLQEGQGTVGKFLKDTSLYDDLHKSVAQINALLADVNAGKGTVGKLLKSDELANQLKATIGRIDLILDKINSGQGTIGQLLVNSQLYDNLAGATQELHALMKDFRANPKKFLHIKLSLF